MPVGSAEEMTDVSINSHSSTGGVLAFAETEALRHEIAAQP